MKIITIADRNFAFECVRCLVSPYEHIWSDLPGLSLGKERVWFHVPSDGYENSKTWRYGWRCKLCVVVHKITHEAIVLSLQTKS